MSGRAARLGEAEPAGAMLAPAALWGLLLSASLVPLGSTTIAVALAAIDRELAAGPNALTQWLVNGYLIVAIALQSPAGKLVDRWGVRRALAVGQALFAAGAMLGWMGSSLFILALARVAMAAGGAFLVPATMAVLRNGSAAERRARVFGAFGATMGLAAAVGPLAGGLLVDTFGWRAIFLANLPVLAVAAPLVSRVPALHRPRPARGFDWTGSAALAVGLILAAAGSRTTGAAAAGLLGLAGAALAVFILWERHAPEPVFDPALFRRSAFAAGAAVTALHNCIMYALLFHLPLWFHTLQVGGAAETGRVLVTMLLGMVAFSAAGGHATGWLGARAVAVCGNVAMLAGLIVLAGLDGLSQPADAIAGLMLIGAGLGLASAPAQAAALSAIPDEQSGMAAGALATIRYLGGMAGIGALSFVLGAAAADGGLVPEAHPWDMRYYAGIVMLATLPAALLPGRGSSIGSGA